MIPLPIECLEPGGGGTIAVRQIIVQVFSREYSHKDFCLAHLFTDLKFEGGILGLAYVGSPRRNSVGGICTPGDGSLFKLDCMVFVHYKILFFSFHIFPQYDFYLKLG